MPYKAHDLVLSIPEFATKWQNSKLTERAAAQSHFIDLCNVIDHPAPTELDQQGTNFTFEKGVATNAGGDGFADVWKRKFFAWEYKRKHEPLPKAYQQLLKYREALENPPLLVVCDTNLFEVHTNWTNTPPEIYSFSLQDLVTNHPTPTCKLPPVEVLRALFHDPERLKPGQTTAEVTADAAKEFAMLAESLRSRGIVGEPAAHFIMRLLFCLFAEDVGLLQNDLFTRLIKANRNRPIEFTKKLRLLFLAMSQEGGSFGPEDVPYFDGGLFMNDDAYELTTNDLTILARAADLNWAGIEPAIFGTLFERILDPDKRSQIGAHYTSKEDITLIVEPVLMEPLRRKWAKVRRQAVALLTNADEKSRATTIQRKLGKSLSSFADEVASIRVLDPACGSGNFLYVSLKLLLDLEKQISVFASSNGLSRFFVRCRPDQLYGIESNIYAHKIASVAVWIGFLQWQRDNGIIITDNPIMQPLENIHRMDAILQLSQGKVVEPEWPDVDVIVGNPPFLGGNKIRQELGDNYSDQLFQLYKDRVPAFSDFVCYWFERARNQLQRGKAARVGLLATQAIRGGVNRTVLERIKSGGDIFWAESDRVWTLEGATVHVAMIGFDDGTQESRTLNGNKVAVINADLTDEADLTQARPLLENSGLWAYGSQQKGSFDIDSATAKELLGSGNPLERKNSDVVRPSVNGKQILQGGKLSWVIDFGESTPAKEAALYEAPFEYLKKVVYPERKNRSEVRQRTHWWLHARPSPKYRRILREHSRYIATPVVSKHRIFVWLDASVLIDHAVVAFARSDDYAFGVLQSKIHELWSRRTGTQVRDADSGFRYTPTTTFEPFPFPWPLGKEPANNVLVTNISHAAKILVEKRNSWLNCEPSPASKVRTLTGLYNQNPTWLQDAHAELDRAVHAAYGWTYELRDMQILTELMKLNVSRQDVANEATPRKTPKPVRAPARDRRASGVK